jgi:hypothetical protein
MTPEQLKNSELDNLVRNVLLSDDDLMIPSGLADSVFRKLEKRFLLRELVLELSVKIGIVLGSLAILTGFFVWFKGLAVLTGLYTQFINNWQTIISLLLLIFVIALIDQVGIKFYTLHKKEVSLKV